MESKQREESKNHSMLAPIKPLSFDSPKDYTAEAVSSRWAE